LSTRIKEAKEKVLFWLKEEALSPEDLTDPNAYFNFAITAGDVKMHVAQNSRQIDSLAVGARWTLGTEQIDLHKNIMDDPKRIAFYWDLQFMLAGDNQLGDYQIGPNMPHDFKELLITSNRVFYDSLTKQALMHSIFAVHKAMVRSVFLLEKHGGVLPPYPPIMKK
jgi:hypothetical protein